MKRLTTLLLLCLVLTHAALAAPPDTTMADRMDAVVPALLDRFEVPGAAVAVIRGGAVVHARGYGLADAEAHVPMAGQAVLNVASVSKPVTAWGVMALVEDGRIQLDAPVNRYLKRLQITSDEYDVDGVTVRRLLSHTSGLSRGSYPGYAPGADVPDLVAALKGDASPPSGSGMLHEVRVVHAPGSKQAYSGTAYAVLEVMMEDVTGQSFPAYMREAVLAPLGMDRSAFGWPDSIRQHAATPHNLWSDTVPIRRFTGDAWGNLNTTARDLGRWLAAAVDGPSGPRGRGVLSPRTVDSMLTVTRGKFGISYEAETLPDGTELWGSSGWNLGWMSRVHVDPATGNGLVVLTNADPYGFMVTRGAHCAWVKADYGVSFDRFCQESAAALAAAAFHDTTATAAIEQVQAQRDAHPDRIYVDEAEFNGLGYRLLDQHRVHHAIEVFRWNVDLHPDAWNAYDSLGEAYMHAGALEKAVQYYEKSLELNPENENAKRHLRTLRIKMPSSGP
jgi:CubicO group peptidase (beta-lactamase class C family)